MDAIGYDAVDCGTLAESWRIEPNTPVYVLPYIGEPPAGLTKDERRRWFREERGARVTADQVRVFAAQRKNLIAWVYGKLFGKAFLNGLSGGVGTVIPVYASSLHLSEPLLLDEGVADRGEDMRVNALRVRPRIANLLFKGTHDSDPMFSKDSQKPFPSNFFAV
jgi:hypothetical protein